MLKNLKLGAKLMLGFSTVALITLFLGLLGFYGAVKNDEAMYEVGEVRLPSVKSVMEMQVEIEGIVSNLRTLLNPGNSHEVRQAQYSQITDRRQEYQRAFAVYEPLPQTAEEAREWNRFMDVIPLWVRVNDQIVELHHELDQLDILNPDELLWQLQGFRGDHYRLELQVAELLMFGEEFQGGDDAGACAFGRWMAEYETHNPEMNSLLQSVREPHNRFHAAVGQIREAVQRNADLEAERLFREVMEPATEAVFDHFYQIIALAERSENLQERIENLTMGQSQDYMYQAFGHLDNVVEINEEIATHEVSSAVAQASMIKALSLGSMIAGVILAMLLGVFLTRSITRPINRIVDGLRSSAEQVSAASAQVSSSSQSSAEGANEQASSLEETSSSLEEMASQTNQNADNAEQADQAMKESAKVVEAGVSSMDRMTEAINEIKDSSSETSKIIKTIDDIAFQTNLLALNAAVEAARAGEAGKGFAVVAEEVRNLAQRSAEAARNTSQLIEKSQENAANGVKVTEQVAGQLRTIRDSAQKVNTLISEITAASKEQAQGVEQVNTAVAEMDKVVQQNASDSEESASAAEELSSQAGEMERMVNELTAIVGSNDQMRAGKREHKDDHPASRPQTPMQARDKKQGLGYRQKNGSRAENSAKAMPGQARERAKRSEQLIPLDKDDFKEF